MAESGSTVEQTEFFILNSQKISKLPDEEAPWSLSCAPASIGSGESLTTDIVSMSTDGEDKCLVPSEVSALETGSKSSRYQIKAGFGLSWPPADWKTAPRFDPHARDLKTQASTSFGLAKDPLNDVVKRMEGTNNGEWTIREDPGTLPTPGYESVDNHIDIAREQTHLAYGTADPARFSIMPDRPEPMMSLGFAKREQFNITAGGSNEHTAATGRLGEELAFRYLKAKYGEEAVRWVNEQKETGLPYDIRTVGKEHGNHNAKVSLFRNPVKLCQQGNLRLIVVMPNQLPQT
ncbi:unnamed protein product [Linum tenue]|uniref:Protein NO VEIN C-terminal domain-containing protein n=1 Tax=Linum tenue TaxID=586396 RepID=A0AAV0LQK7_9ROSI|nr:unnamed protein product [Linum tenue]